MANYHARLGANAKAQADALLGLFQTKIFHAQSDFQTNQYAADLIGKHWTTKASQGTSGQQGGTGYTFGETESLEYKLEPSYFTTFMKGGPSNSYLVQAIVFQGGRIWERTGDTYIGATFDQRQQ